jgi:hypothetical protein
LEKDRESRYRSAADLRADLKQLRQAGSAPAWHRLRILKARGFKIGAAAAVAVLLIGTAIWRFFGTSTEAPLPAVEVVPLGGVPSGHQHRAAFSPDGNQLVFDHGGDQFCVNDQFCGIYTTLIDGEKSLRLTNNPKRLLSEVGT